jgi:hypothetical protein
MIVYLPCRTGRISRAFEGASGRFLRNDRDQARRENRKPKLAMSRTEPSGYSQIPGVFAHASVNAALAGPVVILPSFRIS